MNIDSENQPIIRIHRGSNVIGGNCIEITYNHKSIILDLGMPIMNPDGSAIVKDLIISPSIENGILPDVKGLYAPDNRILGVLLSHPHMDHYGLMNFVDHSIPIYMGKDSHQILKASNIFLSKENQIDQMLSHVITFDPNNPFTIGEFKITPFPIDHSAYGAYCILIEVGGKRIFYSGDFRGHGATKYTFENLINNPPRNLDYLLMEGTSIRETKKVEFETEESVFLEIKRILAETKKITFVMQAGSNITRLIQLYKACLSNRKTLIIDLFQYHLLKELQKLNPNLPPFDRDRTIRVYFHKNQVRKLENHDESLLEEYRNLQIGMNEIIKKEQKMVLRVSHHIFEEIASHFISQNIPLENSYYIFSMWQGYLKQQKYFQEFIDRYNLILVNVHTSGHAFVKDLQRFVKALNPSYLVPIHTLSPEKYTDLFNMKAKI